MFTKTNQSAFKLVIVLLLLLSLMILAGCSGSQSEKDPSIQAPDEQTQDQNGDKSADSEGLSAFQTKDIYGNDIDQELFKDYKLTLVNVWGTFCGPCLEEMPYLGQLQKEYAAKGVNIAGLVIDVQDEDLAPIAEQIDLAKEIVSQTKTDYPHMIISNELIEPVLSQFDAIPASFFVDSDGQIVSEFYIGARTKDEWKDLIDENLKNVE